MFWNKFIITNTPEYPPSRPLLLCYSETYSLQRENLHSNWADNNSPLGGSTGVAGVGGLKNTSTKYIMYYLETKITSPCGHSSAGGELIWINCEKQKNRTNVRFLLLCATFTIIMLFLRLIFVIATICCWFVGWT